MCDKDKFNSLCTKTYKEQGVWFLNAFWDSMGQKEAENVWKRVHELADLDTEKKATGSAVDELQAHRFLERLQETMTVHSMRDKLRQGGALSQQERPKLVPLTHYLIIHYNIDWKKLVNAPQGNKDAIEEAERLLEEVNNAFRESEARASEAKAALQEAKAAEAEAKATEAEAKRTEAEAKRTEAEAKAREAEAKKN